MLMLLSLFSVSIVVVSILGGMLPLASVLSHTRLQVYLSFSAGIMLGAAFLHMLPEAVEIGSPGTIRWAIVGLLSLFFVERFFSFHQHEPHAHVHDGDDAGHGCGEDQVLRSRPKGDRRGGALCNGPRRRSVWRSIP